MVLRLDKRLACGLSFLFKPLVIICLVFSDRSFAQDTISLTSVEVITKHVALSGIGKKREFLDSAMKQQFRFNSVADALNLNTPIFIKTYGPGGIATTSFRGGNASQTAVLWNGFNIQNGMLGQSDLALMPSVLFEGIGVEYGGSSSVFGSGAVGGSIHMNSGSPFNAGVLATANLGGGSFGMKNGSVKVLVSEADFVSSTKVYGISSDNNFKYTDKRNEEVVERAQKNAGYKFYGLMQELKFRLNQKQLLTVSAWLNSNKRRLPAFDPSTESKTRQQDDAARFIASWSFTTQKFNAALRAGFFTDIINYTDSLAAIYSKSKVQTMILENENYFEWGRRNTFNIGVNITSSSGSSTYYSDLKSQSRISLLAGNKFSFLRNRLIAYVSGRLEYFNVGALPVTGNGALEYNLIKGLIAKVNVARVYRQPTLNNLYWQPGGNPDLKPEQGFTYEGELLYEKQTGNFRIYISGAAFSRKIDNWILWVPGANGNPTPMNVLKVWSRGTETTWRFNYRKGKLNYGIGLISGYVLSTVNAQSQENSGTLNKQLIYTPRYTINGNASVGFANILLMYFHQYMGYRFTASDNSAWLNPYHFSSLKANYTVIVKKLNLNFFTACNNLFSEDYVVLAGRPMPGRNYEFGVSIQFHKIKDE